MPLLLEHKADVNIQTKVARGLRGQAWGGLTDMSLLTHSFSSTSGMGWARVQARGYGVRQHGE